MPHLRAPYPDPSANNTFRAETDPDTTAAAKASTVAAGAANAAGLSGAAVATAKAAAVAAAASAKAAGGGDAAAPPALCAWDVLIAHYLGVDHAGHSFGVRSRQMREKVGQIDGQLAQVAGEKLSMCTCEWQVEGRGLPADAGEGQPDGQRAR